MSPRAKWAIVSHLVLCAFVVFLEHAALGLAENLTPAEWSELGRDAVLTYMMLGPAIAWSVCL